MATEESLRAHMKALLELGFTQRALADKLGVSETWLSRWLEPKDDKVRPISVPEMNRFQEFLDHLAKVATKETQRTTETPAITAGHLQRSNGQEDSHRDRVQRRAGDAAGGRRGPT